MVCRKNEQIIDENLKFDNINNNNNNNIIIIIIITDDLFDNLKILVCYIVIF